MIINKSKFMCPNLLCTHVTLQYSIKIEFSHLLQLFSPVVWVQYHYIRLADVCCLGEYNMLTPVISALSQG
jgi:hypothetical protein